MKPPRGDPRSAGSEQTCPGQLIVDFAGVADDGGAGVIAYQVPYTTYLSFVTGVSSVSTGTGHDVCRLTPGQLFYVRVTTKNAITDTPGTVGPWSAAVSKRVGISGKRFDGSAEQFFSTAFRWAGTVEVSLTVAVRWDGTQEVPFS